eukprot:TRINITY_DN2641_c0_g1_i10.p1 TRINITY_DN2641_c0_g1~~TRINITY_DN2641_c0_g1_i10.p1  ORF type:complete len:1049 (+),score=405.44 TRINITY_DN2641_c0_g1_i10:93-3239(+)
MGRSTRQEEDSERGGGCGSLTVLVSSICSSGNRHAARREAQAAATFAKFNEELERARRDIEVKDAELAALKAAACEGPSRHQGHPYLVDNSQLKLPNDFGVAYRFSKRMEDRSVDSIVWGAVVRGVDEGDGWLKVGKEYLPMFFESTAILKPLFDEADTNARDSSLHERFDALAAKGQQVEEKAGRLEEDFLLLLEHLPDQLRDCNGGHPSAKAVAATEETSQAELELLASRGLVKHLEEEVTSHVEQKRRLAEVAGEAQERCVQLEVRQRQLLERLQELEASGVGQGPSEAALESERRKAREEVERLAALLSKAEAEAAAQLGDAEGRYTTLQAAHSALLKELEDVREELRATQEVQISDRRERLECFVKQRRDSEDQLTLLRQEISTLKADLADARAASPAEYFDFAREQLPPFGIEASSRDIGSPAQSNAEAAAQHQAELAELQGQLDALRWEAKQREDALREDLDIYRQQVASRDAELAGLREAHEREKQAIQTSFDEQARRLGAEAVSQDSLQQAHDREKQALRESFEEELEILRAEVEHKESLRVAHAEDITREAAERERALASALARDKQVLQASHEEERKRLCEEAEMLRDETEGHRNVLLQVRQAQEAMETNLLGEREELRRRLQLDFEQERAQAKEREDALCEDLDIYRQQSARREEALRALRGELELERQQSMLREEALRREMEAERQAVFKKSEEQSRLLQEMQSTVAEERKALTKKYDLLQADYTRRLREIQDERQLQPPPAQEVSNPEWLKLREELVRAEAMHQQYEIEVARTFKQAEDERVAMKNMYAAKMEALETEMGQLRDRAAQEGQLRQSQQERAQALQAEVQQLHASNREADMAKAQLMAMQAERDTLSARLQRLHAGSEKQRQDYEALLQEAKQRPAESSAADKETLLKLAEENSMLKSEVASTWKQMRVQMEALQDEKNKYLQEIQAARSLGATPGSSTDRVFTQAYDSQASMPMSGPLSQDSSVAHSFRLPPATVYSPAGAMTAMGSSSSLNPAVSRSASIDRTDRLGSMSRFALGPQVPCSEMQ